MGWWGRAPENAAGFEAARKEGEGEEMGISSEMSAAFLSLSFQ